MHFDFPPEVYDLRDGARELLTGECTAADVRAMWDHPTGHDERRWKQLAGTGLLAVTVPDELAGLGMGRSLVLLLEEAGVVALPEPLVETAAVAAPLLATAAFLNGVSQRLLDMTVAYVKERTQFGVPVGSFQAVKHKLAETLLVTETSKAAAWYAAYLVASGSDRAPGARSSAASVAKAYASDAAAKASFEALQCHGGIGFTWEHDLHLWLKRGEALEHAFGSARYHRRRVADAVFGDA